MKKLGAKLEKMFSAIAFAEAGEFETARELMKEEPALTQKVVLLKKEVEVSIANMTMMAVTYAEAGEHGIAVEIMSEAETKLKVLKDELHKDLAAFSSNAIHI